MDTLAARLRAVRKKAGMSQAELARTLNMPQTTWSNYENGKSKPDYELIDLICDRFELNVEWLLYGRKPVEKTPDSQERRRDPGASSWAPPVFVETPAEDDPYKSAKWQQVPVVGLGNCGSAGWFSPQPTALRATLPVDYPYNPETFAVIAVGTSMKPAGIRQGHVLFCDPSRHIEAGDNVYVETKDGVAAVKTFIKLDENYLHIMGWEEPQQDGTQNPYHEKVERSKIRRMSCVVVIKLKG